MTRSGVKSRPIACARLRKICRSHVPKRQSMASCVLLKQRLMQHCLLDLLRRRSARSAHNKRANELRLKASISNPMRLSRRASRLWKPSAALLHALDGLSPAHRAVVDLTYFHGMGYRDIAAVVDCPVDTVKTRMFHARRRLRSLLAGQDWL